MAGTKRGMPFERTGPFPIDDTFVLSKTEMAAVVDAKMPEKYFAVCKDDGKFYLYDKDATPSAETGKFAVVEGGGGGNLPFTQDVLWESDTDVGNVAQELSESINGYDLLYVQCRHRWSSGYDVRATIVIDVKQIKYGQDQAYSIGPSTGALVYVRFTDDTHFQHVTQDLYFVEKVIGIRFGSSLDGTYGRWEKIDEWDLSTFTTLDVVLDLSPYNAVALSSGHEYTQLFNSVIKVVSDWEVGESIYSYTADKGGEFAVYLTKQSDTLYTLGKAYSRKRAVLYGYREVAVSDADIQRIAAQVRPVPDGGATGQALVKASDADGDVEWANVGGAGGLPVRQDLIWNNGATTNPNTIVLSRSMNGYDQILVEGFVYSSNKYHLFSRLYESADMTTDSTIGLSDAADRYVWYNITAQNQLTYRIGAGNLIMYKIYGIKFGDLTNEQIERVAYEISVLPAISAIGRWEKIGEWTGAQTGLQLDLSPYNAIAFSPIYSNQSPRNSVVVPLSDFDEGEALISENGDTWQGEFQNKGNDTYDIRLSGASKSVLYGYRESALAEADVQRIAAEVNPVPMGGSAGKLLVKNSDADFDFAWRDPMPYIKRLRVNSSTGAITCTFSTPPTEKKVFNLFSSNEIAGTWDGDVFTPTTVSDITVNEWMVVIE